MNGLGTAVVAMLAVVALGSGLAAHDTGARTKHWTNYETFLWMWQGPESGQSASFLLL
ncbi:MAG: hypothetical protein KAX80_14220 [Planctomycetes bacterium]|nr:hypothetical protein [Planctomycetota bacterium]